MPSCCVELAPTSGICVFPKSHKASTTQQPTDPSEQPKVLFLSIAYTIIQQTIQLPRMHALQVETFLESGKVHYSTILPT